MWGAPSFPLDPGALLPTEVAPDRVLSMGQIEQDCVLMQNWIVKIRTVFDIEPVYLLLWPC